MPLGHRAALGPLLGTLGPHVGALGLVLDRYGCQFDIVLGPCGSSDEYNISCHHPGHPIPFASDPKPWTVTPNRSVRGLSQVCHPYPPKPPLRFRLTKNIIPSVNPNMIKQTKKKQSKNARQTNNVSKVSKVSRVSKVSKVSN